jgi:hypothetical protein
MLNVVKPSSHQARHHPVARNGESSVDRSDCASSINFVKNFRSDFWMDLDGHQWLTILFLPTSQEISGSVAEPAAAIFRYAQFAAHPASLALNS